MVCERQVLPRGKASDVQDDEMEGPSRALVSEESGGGLRIDLHVARSYLERSVLLVQLNAKYPAPARWRGREATKRPRG